MLKKVACLAVLAAAFGAAPASAQTPRVEAAVLLGWTLSDGVSGDPVRAQNGQTYDRIDSTDSFKWGFDVGGMVSPNVQVGFLFGQQMSTLEASGTSTLEVGDLTVNTYHGYVAYNFGESDAKARPYFMGGLGATSFSTVDYTKAGGGSGTINGGTQFSSTWGAGVKFYPGRNVGVRVGMQWTPTYIKTDAEGWWCDPWWGCYVVGDAQYSNQLDFNGGITFRF